MATANFDRDFFESKLARLKPTPDSIQALGVWASFHDAHCDELADAWLAHLQTHEESALPLVYFCNEVVQSERQRRPDGPFLRAFGRVLPSAMDACAARMEERHLARVRRTVEVWKTRSVFSKDLLQKLDSALNVNSNATSVVALDEGETKALVEMLQRMVSESEPSTIEYIDRAIEDEKRLVEMLEQRIDKCRFRISSLNQLRSSHTDNKDTTSAHISKKRKY